MFEQKTRLIPPRLKIFEWEIFTQEFFLWDVFWKFMRIASLFLSRTQLLPNNGIHIIITQSVTVALFYNHFFFILRNIVSSLRNICLNFLFHSFHCIKHSKTPENVRDKAWPFEIEWKLYSCCICKTGWVW